MRKQSERGETIKVTLALPRSLVEYADRQAAAMQTNRSRFVASILGAARRSSEDQLAKEGYQFYAREARDFAESSTRLVAEAIDDGGPSW
jgi:hypothetical protein